MALTLSLLQQIENAYGSAFYLLDTEQFRENYRELLSAFRHYYPETHIAYSYKTNYTPRLCKIIDEMGGYAEIVSDMEYAIVKRLGIPTKKVHLNGPYKNQDIVREIILGGGCVNLDDYVEVPYILELANQYPHHHINISIRCNFPIEDTSISRFGFDIQKPEFRDLISCLQSSKNIHINGLHCHYAPRHLSTWKPRASGITKIIKDNHLDSLDHIDLGGGLFGKMKDSLKEQFGVHIPTYEEYAKETAPFIKEFFKDNSKPPKLFIEPGSALVGDVMKFAAKVVSIKDIRGKHIATVVGSVYNINPTLNKKNPPITIYHAPNEKTKTYKNLDFGGYTCIESDYLYKGYDGDLAVGDMVVFDNVGSYSVVLKPPFILPNFPIIEVADGKMKVIKRQETFEDVFQTYLFE